jgi:hypothetical protein
MRCPSEIIRNDDVSVDSTMEDIVWFSELCDKYGFKVLQCVTVRGNTHKIDSRMGNDEIRNLGGGFVFENVELINYLKGREDLIAVHGLWHTHQPTMEDIRDAKVFLEENGLKPTFFVPPFNEGEYGDSVYGLDVSQKTQRLEDYLLGGAPSDKVVYLHSWRFGDWYTKESLELCLKRITMLS